MSRFVAVYMQCKVTTSSGEMMSLVALKVLLKQQLNLFQQHLSSLQTKQKVRVLFLDVTLFDFRLSVVLQHYKLNQTICTKNI